MLLLLLLLVFDPVRLGLILLLICRPRPVPNLLAYWVGARAVSVPYLLVPLTLLHVTPVVRSIPQKLATPGNLREPNRPAHSNRHRRTRACRSPRRWRSASGWISGRAC